MAAKKKAARKKAAKKAAAKKAAPKKTSAKKKAAPKKKAAGKKKAAPKGAKEGKEAASEEDEGPPPKVRKPIPRMPKRKGGGTITLAIGNHPVAAFMMYALAAAKVDTEDRTYAIDRLEQHELDGQVVKARHDVAIFSMGVYPEVDDRYMLLPCAGSFGDHRGPVFVARSTVRTGEVDGLQVAVPGAHSGAALALQLWLAPSKVNLVPLPAPQVSLMVRVNRVRSGVLVREDQVTYRNHNLVLIRDLGQWWGERTEGLPLPLLLGGIRRDIPEEERAKIALDLKRSIAYALGHREETLGHAIEYARKVEQEQLDRYLDIYVNDLSLDCGIRGRQAIQMLFDRAHAQRLLPTEVDPEFHGDEDA